MGNFYEYRPPRPEERLGRIGLSRDTMHSVGEDAMNYVYSAPTKPFDQHIVVPDKLLEPAATALKEGHYVPASPAWDYAKIGHERNSESSFPGSICLQHCDIPDDEPYKLEPPPRYFLLLSSMCARLSDFSS